MTPYPHLSPSPIKSSSATPDVSPSRAGKGKSRSNVPAMRPPPIPAGMMNPLKSISELRNKGESRRFLDEVGYLFEGMDQKGGIGLRRARYGHILIKYDTVMILNLALLKSPPNYATQTLRAKPKLQISSAELGMCF
jgi:hypothetical protein